MCTRAKTASGRGCVLGWLCALCRFRLSDHDTSRCRNIMGAPQMRLKTAGWHQIGRQRSAEGAEGPKWPRWARSEAWTDSLAADSCAISARGDTHASGRGQRHPFYEPQSREPPCRRRFGAPERSCRGPRGRFRGPSYQNTPLEWSRAPPTTPPAPELHDTTACLKISDTSN